MANRDINLTLDTANNNYSNIATVKQLDNITLNILITENGIAKNILNQTITLFAKKADGKIVQQKDEINIVNAAEGKVQIKLKNSAVQVKGYTVAELEISDANSIITTVDFTLKVNEKVGSDEAIDSTNEIALLKEVEIYVNQAKKEIQAFKVLQTEMLNTNETINRNEAQRVTVETSRVNEEKKRVVAEVERDKKIEAFGSQITEIANDFDEVIANITNGNESATNSEIVQARNGEINLNRRLDKFDTHLNSILNKGNDTLDIDINVNMLIQSMELKPLDIPTYVEKNNQIVHPSVLYFEKKWNGYNYWMMATPYTDTNNKWENPCVYCSDDGINWIAPKGVNNPLVPSPDGAGYNADVNLCMDKYGDVMYCTYRVRGEAGVPPHVDLITSKDGVNWSVPKKIMQMPQGEDCAVPNVWYEDEKYYMANIDLDQKDTLKRSILKIYTCDKIDGEWVKSHETQIPNIPANLELWHYELRKIGSQYILMYTIANKGGYGAGGRIYMASSYDLKEWKTSEKFLITPTANDKSSYKSSFIPVLSNSGLKFKVWYSETTWFIYYTEIDFKDITKFTNGDLKFIEDNYNTTIFDDFIKADNSIITNEDLKITTRNVNIRWNKITGSDFSIINNKCKLNSDTNSIACVRIPKYQKYEISTVVDMSYNKPMFIVLRCLNSSNFIRVGLYGDVGVRAQKITNGVISKTYFETSTNAYNDKSAIKITVKITGDKFIIYIDDEFINEFIEIDYSNNPFFGIQADNKSVTFDYFIVYTDGFLIDPVSEHNEKCINTINGCINKEGYCDTFNRDDNELLLGGKFICIPDGSFGIIDKQAYSSKVGNNFAIYDTKNTSYTIETIVNINGGFSIPIRYIDNNNFIRINYNNATQLVIQKVESGSVTDLSSIIVSNFINSNNDKLLRIDVTNSKIVLYENGIKVADIVNNFNSTATKTGIQNSKLENRVKTYLVY